MMNRYFYLTRRTGPHLIQRLSPHHFQRHSRIVLLALPMALQKHHAFKRLTKCYSYLIYTLVKIYSWLK